MREVDEALARAHAYRAQSDQSIGVPPAPHWTARAFHSTLSTHPKTVSSHELQWPPLILSLEQNYNARFDRMAQSLIDVHNQQGLRAILFTSCHRAEGRTTLVLTLARALSRQPIHTLILDADLTGPMVARLLNLRPQVGLEDVIDEGKALTDALIVFPDDHLAILPMRKAATHPRKFLASPAWTCTLARLHREFDLILVDGGPLFTGLSATLLHRSVDAAVLVHHSGTTGERAVLRAREVLTAGGIPVLGSAETFV